MVLSVKSILAGLTMLIAVSAAAQYPAVFNAPKGIFILLDTTWHKGTVINIERGESSSTNSPLVIIPVPADEKGFVKNLHSAEKEFPISPAATDAAASAWWNGLNQSPSMPVFLSASTTERQK